MLLILILQNYKLKSLFALISKQYLINYHLYTLKKQSIKQLRIKKHLSCHN